MAQPNKNQDLRNHLFEQLERLNDEALTKEELQIEATRAKAMVGISSQILQSAKLELDAAKQFGYREAGTNYLEVSGNKNLDLQ